MVVQALVGFGSAIFQGAAWGFSWLVSRPFHTTALAVYLAALILVWFNAPLLFADPERATDILTVYGLLLALLYASGDAVNPLLGISAGAFVLWFALGTSLGGFLFSFLQPINPDVSPIVDGTWIGFVAIAALVVAIGEELGFRGALAQLFGGGMGGQFISALIFGGAHVYAYSQQAATPQELAASLAFVTLLGLFFGYLTEKLPVVGFVLACAFHFAWNLYTYGILGA